MASAEWTIATLSGRPLDRWLEQAQQPKPAVQLAFSMSPYMLAGRRGLPEGLTNRTLSPISQDLILLTALRRRATAEVRNRSIARVQLWKLAGLFGSCWAFPQALIPVSWPD